MPFLSLPVISPSPSNVACKEPFLHATEATRCHFKEFNFYSESPMLVLLITPHWLSRKVARFTPHLPQWFILLHQSTFHHPKLHSRYAILVHAFTVLYKKIIPQGDYTTFYTGFCYGPLTCTIYRKQFCILTVYMYKYAWLMLFLIPFEYKYNAHYKQFVTTVQ